ncbi:MAG: sulfurtransferase-like selenium metabolism protein YedF [Ruminococcaceae bacterium]|nr:sulfurtransferase-like selenium metabolism protein YedF [Oscillospiraceae bacterium]
MANTVVDARGEQCPIPVVKATKAIAALTEPGIVEVHVDNEIAVQNLLRMASGKGFAAKSEQVEEKHYLITIDVDRLAPADAAEPEAACIPDLRGSTVVAVGTAIMGVGSDELGATLMKGFLYALSQQDELPKTILFYNGGAKLTTEGSASIEDLKTMESQGVEILTCGTCLDYYGLKDKLLVGSVTNMYAIVEKLTKAAKVVKP